MIVYKDLISGDEMMTYAFPRNPVHNKVGNVVEGIFEVESSMSIKGADNVDIGCGNAFGGEDETTDSSLEKVNNIAIKCRKGACPPFPNIYLRYRSTKLEIIAFLYKK